MSGEDVRYVLHPGHMTSINDGQEHYVGIGALRELYLIPPGARVVIAGTLGYREMPGDIHCRPRYKSDSYPRFQR